MKKTVRAVLGLVLIWGVLLAAPVYAEENAGEKYIYRESSGSLEELSGYCLTDEEAEAILAGREAQSVRWGGSEAEQAFLTCGSDYGYQDMLKRSNSGGRRAAYRKLAQAASAFTLGREDCQTIGLSDGEYALAGTVDIKDEGLTSEEIMETYFTFRNDNPQYFWLSNKVAWGAGNIFILTYSAYGTGAERGSAFREILQTSEEVYEPRAEEEASDHGKVLAIHDTLIGEIEYPADTDRETAHSIAGAMTSERSAVCEGYAKVMQLFMNRYDIPNIYVTGFGGSIAHAWNLVQMPDGNWYWLDATWDDQAEESLRHRYFLVGNSSFLNHVPDSPEASGVSFLYELPEASDTDYEPDNEGGQGGTEDPDRPGTGGEELRRGDIDGDGRTDISDLRLLLRAVCGKISLDGGQMCAADVTGDGAADIADLRMILRYVCGKIAEL